MSEAATADTAGTDLVEVAPLSEIPEDRCRIFDLDGLEIGLVRSGDRVHAIRNICPHQDAPVCRGAVAGTMLPSEPGQFVYGLQGRLLRCPWHGWEFSLETGELAFTHGRGRLRLYPTAVRDGRVYVELRRRSHRT